MIYLLRLLKTSALRHWHFLVMASMLAWCAGCAFITIPLGRGSQPLQETVVAGSGKAKILLVDISGVISLENESGLMPFEGKPSMVARVKEELSKAARDKHIKGVVLRINSPGGTVTASDILYQEVVRFKKEKGVPVVACMMDIAASGGYYVALAADEILAHPTTVTGSIGVIAIKFNAQGLMEKIGVQDESLKAGDKKDLWSPLRPAREEEREILQHIADSMHSHFIDIVASSRQQLTREQIVLLADGRIYTAPQAAASNLIDGIGYLEDAVDSIESLAGVKEARIILYHRPFGYKNNIYSHLAPLPASTLNLINVDLGSLATHRGVSFMYLWCP
ncbi:MAG TPA: signal peptide peptidase SppA [Thermodesulfobacteriota bacterium]|nr:signal peptide peptidase SppA [Thermodesulfobacteriota bacterium]HNU72049.1 signal peptide peptidase SppA [Thermodesulfobacteriota bacterium]HOC39377.1 signal peptide peptidase SppA [Thermodesulfobacteriota bacterium]